jgi:methylated-DNA-[protein]-cysteine S-methyltransferase
MVEVSIRTLDGASGPLQVAATRAGIVAAEWHLTDGSLLASLRRRFRSVEVASGRGADPSSQHLDVAWPVLEGLICGQDAPAASLPVDLRDRPAFDRAVLAAVREVGWGETASYGEIARRVGAPRAARAVGGALGRNPVALVIPCHRVIAGDGTLGGYGGDGWRDRAEALDRKRALLALEGVTVGIRAR